MLTRDIRTNQGTTGFWRPRITYEQDRCLQAQRLWFICDVMEMRAETQEEE